MITDKFHRNLAALRRDSGLSQKKVSADLGISQALLSHYEKGIRECGHSFLMKVADFYGVTCDYLLGRSSERNDILAVAENLLMLNNDFEPTSKTFIKAAMILREAMNSSEKIAGLKLDMVLAIGIYRLLLIQANAGNIPKNWAGRAYADGKVICTGAYLNIIDTENYAAFKITPAKTGRSVSNDVITKTFQCFLIIFLLLSGLSATALPLLKQKCSIHSR